ncbi:MAG: hypothetical protein V3V18_05150 [Methylococcales bacterium]
MHYLVTMPGKSQRCATIYAGITLSPTRHLRSLTVAGFNPATQILDPISQAKELLQTN